MVVSISLIPVELVVMSELRHQPQFLTFLAELRESHRFRFQHCRSDFEISDPVQQGSGSSGGRTGTAVDVRPARPSADDLQHSHLRGSRAPGTPVGDALGSASYGPGDGSWPTPYRRESADDYGDDLGESGAWIR